MKVAMFTRKGGYAVGVLTISFHQILFRMRQLIRQPTQLTNKASE
jgi:hypothetical protein